MKKAYRFALLSYATELTRLVSVSVSVSILVLHCGLGLGLGLTMFWSH